MEQRKEAVVKSDFEISSAANERTNERMGEK